MKELLKQWGSQFDEAQISFLFGNVWRVDLAGKIYVLKRRTNRTHVWEEYDLINWLSNQNQPISRLLYTTEDMPWAEHQGSVFVLYPYVEGISGDSMDLLAKKIAREIGSKLARLQQDLALYDKANVFPNFDLFKEVASHAWPTVQSYLVKDFRHRIKDLEEAISGQLLNPYESLPRQLIHRDFQPANLIFLDNQLQGILGFDRVRLGVRLYDLCYLSVHVLNTVFADLQQRKTWLDFVRYLLAGYHAIEPLTKAEAYSFLYIIYLIQIRFIADHLDAGNSALADVNVGMLLWLREQHAYFEPLIVKQVTEQT